MDKSLFVIQAGIFYIKKTTQNIVFAKHSFVVLC